VKKLNITSFIILACGLLTLFAATVFFQFFTYEEDGSIHGDWRSNESMIYLGTVRIISYVTGAVILLGILLFLISSEKTARKQNIAGILFITLGALTVIGLLNSFYPCSEMMRMNNRPMRCYWTMKTVLCVAGAIGISGALMLLMNKSRELLKGFSFSVIILCCLILLIPSKITGYCLTTMTCVEKSQPFTIMMGAVMLIISVLNVLLLNKKTKQKK